MLRSSCAAGHLLTGLFGEVFLPWEEKDSVNPSDLRVDVFECPPAAHCLVGAPIRLVGSRRGAYGQRWPKRNRRTRRVYERRKPRSDLYREYR